MPNEEVLGPRKTIFVLVIVVGCFAVLWPRILSPAIMGTSQEQLKPNQFDREAGCCEVMFGSEIAVLELINEVCSQAVHVNGKLSPYAAAECRKAVNETCGLDIAAFLKRTDNIGKTSKILIQTMKSSNSSCLKEHFGVPSWSTGPHPILYSWTLEDTMKQERPSIRGGPHPAFRERGRAIPPGPPPPQRAPQPLPPHVRVKSSPLSVYFELEVKPPPIPGMRPPLGSPGGPVPTPKSSMGFVMPIYTICIIVFFVYTLSKILFKRTGPPYEPITPDPQFRRRVFRDDSRTSPDKLVVTAISGLVAEVQQQMDASYAQNQQQQEMQDNQARPYTNGTILHNTGPVHIVASEYRESSKEKSPEIQKDTEPSPELAAEEKVAKDIESQVISADKDETKSDLESKDTEIKEPAPEPEEPSPIVKESTLGLEDSEEEILTDENKVDAANTEENKEFIDNIIDEVDEDLKENVTDEEKRKNIDEDKDENMHQQKDEYIDDEKEDIVDEEEKDIEIEEKNVDEDESKVEEKEVDIDEQNEEITTEKVESNHVKTNDLIKLTENEEVQKNKDTVAKLTEDFLKEESKACDLDNNEERTKELLEEAIEEDSDKNDESDDKDQENASVKVLGMEITAHTADGGAWPKAEVLSSSPPLPTPAPPARPPHEAKEVKSIYLEADIPQKSRVLVADFAEDRTDRPEPTKHSPMVVSGKMTLSLIQDARDTPERDPESTVDDFTTASALTQPAAEKEEELSDEEIEEEIEIEEIEEEVEEVEEEEEEEEEEVEVVPKKQDKTSKAKGTE